MAHLAAGLEHTLVVRDGALYRCGVHTGAVLPKADDWDPRLQPVPGLDGHPIVHAAAGWHHSVALTATGALLTFGTAQFGQLGLGVVDGDRPFGSTEVRLPNGRAVRAAAAGAFHTLVADEDGAVWAFGSGSKHQLGLGRKMAQAAPVRLPLDGVRAVGVAGGVSHSAVWTGDGALLTFGRATALGAKPARDRATPMPVAGVPPVAEVALGEGLTVARTLDGRVLTCGVNGKGELGDPRRGASSPVLAEVPVLEGIVAVAAGSHHVLALDGDGKLWSFGWGVFGALGHGDERDCPEPKIVDGFDGEPIVEVAAGHGHSVARGASGALFAWGDGARGQTGSAEATRSYRPQRIERLAPR